MCLPLQADVVVARMEMEGLGSLDPAALNAALGLPPPLKDDAAGLYIHSAAFHSEQHEPPYFYLLIVPPQ